MSTEMSTSYASARQVQRQRLRGPSRILYVSEPGIAGVKRHVCHALNELSQTVGYEVALVYSLCRSDSTYRSEIDSLRRKGVNCVQIPMQRQISPYQDLRALISLSRFIRAWQPDIVHCHSAKAGILGRLATTILRSPAVRVYTPHAMPCYFSQAYHRVEQVAGRLTDWLIAVSESERDDMLRWKIVADDRVRYLPLAMVPPTVRVSNRCSSDEYIIGACGRVCAQKRALLFFQVGEALLATYPRARLVWVGDFSQDQESEAVRKFIAASSYQDRMEVTGWVSQPHERLASMDVFCMFSRYESFGFVTADAMTLGVPVVAVDGTGTRDLVLHGRTGLIFDGSVNAGALAIQRVLNDSVLRARLIQQAAAHIEQNFSPQLAQRKLLAFYDEALRLGR